MGARFCLDQPNDSKITSHIVRVSGWFLDRRGKPASSVDLLLNGRPVFQAGRSFRLDVARALPDQEYAANSGFLGDVVLSTEQSPPTLSVRVNSEGGESFAHTFGSLILPEHHKAAPLKTRFRDYALADLYSDVAREAIAGNSADIHFQLVERVPHFHLPGHLPLLRLDETGQTHGYPRRSHDLIGALNKHEIFLDLGCGIRPNRDILSNGIYLDAVHFPGVDVVSTTPALPFKDNCVDLIISHAVFEHVSDPTQMAREALRILKPGCLAYIDTAFMQPFHGDPNHYFNMTKSGLAKILDGFELLELGVAPWQAPSWGLRMQIDSVAGLISGRWARLLADFREQLELYGDELDNSLGPIGRETMAAGVYALAKKPA